jgi:uncharacterized protein
VLVLLPPSEGKAVGGTGPPVDFAELSWPVLTATRERLTQVLVAMCRAHPARAHERLGLSPALDADRAANAELLDSPTMPAGERYRGVLHDALNYPTLPAGGRRRADDSLIVFSGLWGATRPPDLLPAYRIGINTRLPRLATLPALWHRPLAAALDEAVAAEGAIDLRSTGYSLMYRPSAEAAERLVTVRIAGPDGRRAAASFQAKVAKGRLVREMVRQGTPSITRLLAAAQIIGVDALAESGSVLVRLPPGWGLVGGTSS